MNYVPGRIVIGLVFHLQKNSIWREYVINQLLHHIWLFSMSKKLLVFWHVQQILPSSTHIFPKSNLQKKAYKQRKTESCNTFHFRWLPAKLNVKILWKLRKTIVFAHFGSFLSIIVKTRTFRENLLLSLFLFPYFYCCEEFQNKTTKKIKKKLSCRHTYT